MGIYHSRFTVFLLFTPSLCWLAHKFYDCHFQWCQVLLPLPNRSIHSALCSFVVYNHLFKSKQTLIDSIIAFHDRTIRLDSIKKCPDGYCRSFFKRSTVLDKYYREEPNGSDIIFDHRDKQILAVEWRNTGDTVCANFFGKNYKVLITDTATISIYSLSQLVNEKQK